MPAWLFALFAAAFVLYTDDYVIAGILPELAADLGVSESHAGQLITAFSLTVAIVAPLAAVVLAKVPRRKLFTVGLCLFILANALAVIVPSYPPPSNAEGGSCCGCSWDDSCGVRLRGGTGSGE